MNIPGIVRRTHLYLGILLAPWFLMYGISAMMMNQAGLFGSPDAVWIPHFERAFSLPVNRNSREEEIARGILRENNLSGPFYVQRPNRETFIVTHFRFLKRTRFTYFIDQRRLLAEEKQLRINDFLTGMHSRGGFEHASLFHDLWALVVDIVAVAVVVWVASGLYMWLQLSTSLRKWGLITIGAGLFTFGYFLFVL